MYNRLLVIYLELVVSIVTIRVQPPVVGQVTVGVHREVVVRYRVGDVGVAARVRVGGLDAHNARPDGYVFVHVVGLDTEKVKKGTTKQINC